MTIAVSSRPAERSSRSTSTPEMPGRCTSQSTRGKVVPWLVIEVVIFSSASSPEPQTVGT
eukprot:173157-Prymnesium_polylepis.1